MCHKEILKNGLKQKVIVPVIHNLIFILSTREILDQIKQKTASEIPMRYIMDKATKQPIVIRDTEMNHFIAACGTMDERLIFIPKIEPSLQKGALVRITGGPFSGIEGRVVRIKKDRRVLVEVNGLIAVATAFIDPLLLESIE